MTVVRVKRARRRDQSARALSGFVSNAGEQQRNLTAEPSMTIDEIIDAKIDAAIRRLHLAPFNWVRCGPSTVSTRQAYALQRRYGARLSKLGGKYLHIHRHDLDAIAEKTAVRPVKPEELKDDPLAGVDPAIRAAFERAARGE